MKPPSLPELSRPLRVDKVPAGGMQERIIARPAEKKALAVRFDLIDLPKLEAELNVDPTRGKMFAVTGTLKAEIVQLCGVTMEPLTTRIMDTIDVLFAPPAILDPKAAPQVDLGCDDEVPEPIVDGHIDLGELVAQHLAIAIPLYPRKEGLPPLALNLGPAPTKKATHRPFEGLAKMEKKRDD